MKHIRLYENFEINEAAQRIVWKRPNMGRGMSNIGHNNELRDWQLFVNAEQVLSLSNYERLASSLRGNAPVGWRIYVKAATGPGFTLKETFPTKDIEEAKEFALEWYKMMTSLGDDAPKDLKDMRAKMKFPEKPKTRSGEFKKILGILRTGLGDRFGWYISTDRISPPRTRMVYDPDTFHETGTFRWVDTRNDPKDDIERLEEVLGDEWTVTYTKGNGQGTIKFEKKA